MKEIIKTKLRTKKGITCLTLILTTLVLGLSYGAFVITSSKYKASEMLISELMYGITITEDTTSTSTISGNTVTIPANTKSYFYITVSSVNTIDSNYTLAYKGNINVEYTDRTAWEPNGVIKGSKEKTNSKTVRIVIDNNTSNSETVSFKVYGGYTFNSIESINLKDGYKTIGGPYTETLAVNNSILIDKIESELKCSNKSNCKYSGGSIKNYLQYPESSNKEENLWRIIGTYNIDNNIVAKIVKEKVVTTSKAKIGESLNSIYDKLDSPDKYIYETNKFNCTSSVCETSDYNKIGLISSYEYETIGGSTSYLKAESPYYIIDNNKIKIVTKEGIKEAEEESGIRPSVYLKSEVKVNGRGTREEPYIIVKDEGKDINIVAVTLNGEATGKTYDDLIKDYYIKDISCDKGTKAMWDYKNASMILSNIKIPDYCTINFVEDKTLYAALTYGKKYPIVKTRSIDSVDSDTTGIGFNDVSSEAMKDTTGVIYLESGKNGFTEDGKDVYYFAGNPLDNWVKFAGYYWRIIRTNEDGSVRLLYAGTSPDTTTGYITVDGKTTFVYNSKYQDIMYVGWMYGTNGSLENNRQNTNKSTAMDTLEKWYKTSNICNADDSGNCTSENHELVSKGTIYCNDRSTAKYSTSVYEFTSFAANDRLLGDFRPSYKCGVKADGTLYESAQNEADKMSANKSNRANGKLDYPVGLMTADELAFAGGKYATDSPNTYYSLNSAGGSVTGGANWWTMSPGKISSNLAELFFVRGQDALGYFGLQRTYAPYALRPVISLASGVLVSSGKGTATEPYVIQ